MFCFLYFAFFHPPLLPVLRPPSPLFFAHSFFALSLPTFCIIHLILRPCQCLLAFSHQYVLPLLPVISNLTPLMFFFLYIISPSKQSFFSQYHTCNVFLPLLPKPPLQVFFNSITSFSRSFPTIIAYSTGAAQSSSPIIILPIYSSAIL